ncbi:MAG: hypothetical protein Q8L27_04330, partial [archaeon]|nr:hypothetical protein [archaeon]
MNKKLVIPLLIVFSIFIAYSVLAHSIVIFNGNTEFKFNEDITSTYGFNFSNIDPANNYTAVEIRLPNSFEFVQNSNITTNFNNTIFLYNATSKILSWQNTYGLILISSTETFYFNAISSQPGQFNISVVGTGTGLGTLTKEFNVTINDTTAPTINYYLPATNPKNTNLTGVIFNLTTEDYSSVNSAIFKLFNSSNYLINETISANPSIYLN